MYHPIGQTIAETAKNIAKREALSIACRKGGVPETALTICVDKILSGGLGISEAIAAAKAESSQAQRNTKLFIAGGVVVGLIGLMMVLKTPRRRNPIRGGSRRKRSTRRLVTKRRGGRRLYLPSTPDSMAAASDPWVKSTSGAWYSPPNTPARRREVNRKRRRSARK